MKYLILFLLSFNLLAQDIVVLKKGDVVPFDGVLFSKEKELQLRQLTLDKQALEKQNETLNKLFEFQQKEIEITTARIILHQEQNNILADKVVRQQENTFWQNVAYFGLGVVITGVVSYGAFQIYK